MKLSVVIPTYNERETLPSLIEELLSEIKKNCRESFHHNS